MPPPIASLLTCGFIVWLFRRDLHEKSSVTGALWLPLIWMIISFSRPVTEWLSIFGINVGGASVEAGSPVDACFYYAMIVAGIYVLAKRGVSFSEIFRNNRWLVFFFFFCFLAVFWSDFVLISFKRWTKVFGPPIMVLIILTEPDPEEALKRLMKRCAYVVVPVSILFIKYYPQWGRSFSEWTGQPENSGIAIGKNLLGADCFILCFFFLWHFLNIWKTGKSKARRDELLLSAGFLSMIGWLLYMAHSSTSLVVLTISFVVLTFAGLRVVNKNYIGTYLLAVVVISAVAEFAFGISEYFFAGLGKDPTLTGRTELWGVLLHFNINPLFGTGFEGFWLGERTKKLWEVYWWHPNESHNGYLETYLNLGLIGLFLLVGWIFQTFWKIRSELLRNSELGKFRLALLAAILIYNWTEAAFRTLHPVFFIFCIITMDYPKPQLAPMARAAEPGEGEEVEPEPELEGVGGLRA